MLPWDWSPVLDALDGTCLEVSTAGLHKPHGRLYPEPELLRAAHERGVEHHPRLRRPPAVGGRARPRPGHRARPRRRLRDASRVFDGAAAEAGAAWLRLRVGTGFDAHALVEGVPLVLGGIELDHPRGLAGHSDGDVLVHALIDAILGGAGLGDIGSLFPSGDERWRGASSLDLLRRAYADVRAEGFELVNADVVLIGEEPRLAPHRERMRAAMAAVLDVEPERIAVRATTTDGLGFTGRGEGLAAQAAVLLRRDG